MSLVQKLIIDKELTGNVKVIVRDETGIYNSSNTTGYGGNNGNPVSGFVKYIFDLYNLTTNTKYRQIQSDNLDEDTEYHNPSIARIIDKENVDINSNNFDIPLFPDGLYKLFMNIMLSNTYICIGNSGTNVVNNVTNTTNFFNQYKAIIVGDEIYKVISITTEDLILDRNIVNSFTSFNPVLYTSKTFIISDNIKECLDSSIAKLSKDCDYNNINNINLLSEIELYYWGMEKSIEINDISQAYEYFQLINSLLTK